MTDASLVVREFLDALQRADTETALSLLDPEIEWRNSGLPTLRGKRATGAIRDMERRGIGFEVVFHHLAVGDDGVVLTDRTDVLSYRRFRMEFWVCGTFTLRDGLITVWDDHFSMSNFIGASLVGLAKTVRKR
ncbi:MAG: limonene-1,2-epoxide hydrolase family protein [Nocardioides sp.]